MQRCNGRLAHQLRPVTITHNAFGYAPGSVLFELGNTKVLCSVSLQLGVPHFLKGKKEGWLTAEYALLPTATHIRCPRESAHAKRNDRAIEISRLIGRSLRAVVDLRSLGERTIVVDCDVLQADGSTRTAAITGAYIALEQAMYAWLERGDIVAPFITESVAAVSVGCSQGAVLLDLDYKEDSSLDADYNVVLTSSGKIIEIQGTAEKGPIAWPHFDQMMSCAREGMVALFTLIQHDDAPHATRQMDLGMQQEKQNQNTPKISLFSLKARLKTAVE